MENWYAGTVRKGNKLWAGIVHSALALLFFWGPQGPVNSSPTRQLAQPATIGPSP